MNGRGVQTGEDRLVDLRRVREVAGYGVKSVWRHKGLFLLVVALVTVSAAALYESLPRTWRARAVLQMTPNPTLAATVNPRRYFTRDQGPSAEAALRAAAGQRFLLELVDRHDLAAHWEAHRSPLQKLRDAVKAQVSEPLTDEERRLIMLGTLESRLTVTWNGGERADIAIAWPEPKMARTLVQDVQQRFLELRRQQLTEGTRGAIAVLEGAVGAAQGEVDGALAVVEAERRRLRGKSRSSTLRGMQAEGKWNQLPDAELMRLRTEILSRRHTLSALEAQRSERVATTESEVRELATRYGEAHPAMADATRRLQALKSGSPELRALRDEERSLLAEYVSLGGRELDLVDSGSRPSVNELEDGDPRLANAREQLRLATARFTDMADRLQTARLELAATENTFEEGFSVVRPATAPMKPDAPSLVKMVAVGFLAGLLLALFAALWLDLRRGVLFERWQVERAVGAPVLSEVRQQ